MASPGNQHCANCIGTLSFPVGKLRIRGRMKFTACPPGIVWSSRVRFCAL